MVVGIIVMLEYSGGRQVVVRNSCGAYDCVVVEVVSDW